MAGDGESRLVLKTNNRIGREVRYTDNSGLYRALDAHKRACE